MIIISYLGLYLILGFLLFLLLYYSKIKDDTYLGTGEYGKLNKIEVFKVLSVVLLFWPIALLILISGYIIEVIKMAATKSGEKLLDKKLAAYQEKVNTQILGQLYQYNLMETVNLDNLYEDEKIKDILVTNLRKKIEVDETAQKILKILVKNPS